MKTMTLDDVMTRTVVVASQDLPFKELVALMHEHRVSGVPIVDADGHLVGIVTEADLLLVEEEATAPRRKHRSAFLEWFINPKRLHEIERRGADLRAKDIMTREVVTGRPETGVHEAVKRLLDAGVKRLPVVDEENHVLGIASRRDLLGIYLRPDDEIRKEIEEDVIFRTMWLDPSSVGVEVGEGVATLRGQVERRSVKEILVELVARVTGVVGVEDLVTYRLDDREIRPLSPYGAPLRGENWIRVR